MSPKYWAVLADFNSMLWNLYGNIIRHFFLDTLITSHLSGLNSIDQFKLSLQIRVRKQKLAFLFLNQNICCGVGTQKNRLSETVRLSTQNKCLN